MLKASEIEVGYSGSCSCEDWDNYLSIILKCILSGRAPYSPIFYNEENQFFFYFHHSGSIGFYYKKESDVIKKILARAISEFDIKA
jgi:hypothetical protein